MDNPGGRVPNFTRSGFLLHIVFASTSGHTEYVVDTLIDSLKGIVPEWEIEKTMAEKTQPQDLLRGDVLVLASATWNTGGIEGQLNPHSGCCSRTRRRIWIWPVNGAHVSGLATIAISIRLGQRIICSTTLKRIMAS
jgi:hypothetical protein